MAHLSDITIYPIKSCGGIAVQEATLTRTGLMSGAVRDREWMVVDEAGVFLTQREHPQMALIATAHDGAALSVRAPGMEELEIPIDRDAAPAATMAVRVWDDSLAARDCGAVAAAWFSRAVGMPCRLVRFDPDARRLASAKWTGDIEAPTLFSDGFPVLVVGAASLADLNARLRAQGREALPMNRFRPNLVIEGTDAFEEDYVESFRIGEAVLKPVKPCGRCPIPSVDQATGMVGPDPLDILQGYRAKPQLDGAICFGMNAIVLAGEGAILRAGQEIEIELAF